VNSGLGGATIRSFWIHIALRGEEGLNGDTVSRTLTDRLPHPLLFVKWEIKIVD